MNSRHRFLLFFFIFVSIFMILVKVFDAHTSEIENLKQAISQSYKLNSDALILRKNEKNFLTRLSWDELKKFQMNATILDEDLEVLEDLIEQKPYLIENLGKIRQALHSYKETFFTVSQIYEKIGIDYDHGLKGRVKQTFLKLESFLWQLENQEFSYRDLIESYHHETLKLALSEKNFLLRPSQKYIQRFKDQLENLEELISQEPFLNKGDQEWLLSLLADYVQNFYQLSELMLDLDYSSHSPLVSLSQYAREFEVIVNQTSSKIVDELITSENGARTYSTLLMLFFAFGLLSLAMVPFLFLMSHKKDHMTLIEEQV